MSTGAADARPENAKLAVEAQNTVLRLLTQADDSMNKGEISQAAAGVLAMLEAIRKGQTGNLNATLRSVGSHEKLPEAVVDRQDNLAQDTEAMIGFCRSEAKENRQDAEFGKLMAKIADKAVELKLQPSMVNIAEIMDSDRFADAIPPQHSVTNGLAVLMDYLNAWRESETQEKTEGSPWPSSKKRATSIKKWRNTRRAWSKRCAERRSGDKTEKLDEDMLEEIAELKENMAQAMLKTATDLQSMPDLDPSTNWSRAVSDVRRDEAAEGSGTNAVVEPPAERGLPARTRS
jgi:hypothetical protein